MSGLPIDVRINLNVGVARARGIDSAHRLQRVDSSGFPPVFRLTFCRSVPVLVALVLAVSASGARVESFSPQGFNKDVRQVAVRFSEAMVALGDPDLAEPFVVDCPVPGTGRWIDHRHWVYDFEYDVPSAVVCRFELRQDARTLTGDRLEPQEYAFHTGGPSILDHRPKAWRTWETTVVDERQVFLLALDGVADAAAISQYARCHLVGQRDQIPVEVVEGEAREKILRALDEASPRTLSGLVQSTHAHLPLDADQAMDLVALVKCRDELPGGVELRLVWGAGVSGGSGLGNLDDQVLEFVVRPRFRIELDCSASFEGKCLGSVSARFTAPVDRALAERVRIVDERGIPLVAEVDATPQVGDVRFPLTLAENASYRVELLGPIEDIDGRPLTNDAEFPTLIETGQMPPGATFGTGLRIVPAGDGAAAHVLLRHPPERLTGYRLRIAGDRDIARWLSRIDDATRDWTWDGGWPNPQAATHSILAGRQGVEEFQLIPQQSDSPFQPDGVSMGSPGLHVLELPLPASTAPSERRFVLGAVMATNLAIDFQHGYESSLVWVTAIDDATAVANADVRLSDACADRPLWRGRTDADGLARIDGPLPWGSRACPGPRLISVRKDGDVSAMRVYTPWWFNRGIGPTRFHTIFDRSLYQPGETVSMKHVLRIPSSDGFALPPGLPTTADLTIEHQGSGDLYRQTVDLDADGVSTNEFVLPPEARLGRYRVVLAVEDSLHHRSRFRVERFRVGTIRAAVSGPELPMVNPESVPLELSAWHLAGGPAAHLPVVLRIMVLGDDPYSGRYWRDRWWDNRSNVAQPEVRTEHLILDGDGTALFEVRDLPSVRYAGRVQVEMEYRDANGQVRAESNRFSLRPASVDLEIPQRERSEGHFRILARHLDRSPAAEVPVEAGLFSYSQHEVDVRLPGGFRAGRRDSTSKLEGECAGRTDSAGALECEIPPNLDGQRFLVRATALDKQGNVERMAGWVPSPRGRDRSFVEIDSQEAFSPGATASLDVDLPFAHATTLVSVQREGVLDAFVTNLEGSKPRTTLPIEPNYAPNVSVSVLARNQPRAPGPARTPQVVQTGADGRLVLKPASPTWRRGAVDVPVDWAANALDVRVTADRETYKPRERIGVQIAVLGADGIPRADTEVAVAAVDEGLLDLRPNRSWEILDVMMQRRWPLIETNGTWDLIESPLTLWGEKPDNEVFPASPPSFSSSRLDDSEMEGPISRHRFNSLLLWQARLATDASGLAEIEVPLNDLLTSVRIVAVATAGTNLFGTGHVIVRTSQDLILNAGLPDVVRHGDRFRGVFTVRNASDKTQRIEAAARIEGYLELPDKVVTLGAGELRELAWTVTVPADRQQLAWDVTARSETTADRLLATQSVQPSVPVRVLQATLTQVADSVELPVAPPHGALPGRGGVALSLRSSLAGGLEAMRQYMEDYPYTCVEQLVSVAVALDDPSRWSTAMGAAGRAVDDRGLLRYFPVEGLPGSPVLTAYVLTIADAAGKVIPEGLRADMIRGLRNYVVANNDTPARPRLLARDRLSVMSAVAALARYGRASGRMLDGIDPSVEMLPTSALIDWIDILQRMAPANAGLSRAKRTLRARLNLQGTTLGFSTEQRDRLPWLMVSGDDNAARALVSMLDDPEWRADLPRMMRGLLGRQQRGRWRTTVANAWGAVAVSRFGARFETQRVAGTTRVRYGEVEQQASWPAVVGEAMPTGGGDPEPIEIPWGSGETISLGHEGQGAPWGLVTLRAAVPLRQAANRGYRIARTVEPVSRAIDDAWQRGDVARVVLDVVADADMTWVVVDDPLPPGAVVLGSGLRGQSSMLAGGGFVSDGGRPLYVERGVDSYRAYYGRMPKGRLILAYHVRYNTAGEFHLPPARVEAMYAPEMHAEWPIEPMVIK